MKRKWSNGLVLFLTMGSLFALATDKPIYAEDAEKSAVNLVKNGNFDDTVESQNKWTGKSAVNWNTPWIPKSEKDKYQITITDDGILMMSADSEMRAVVAQDITVEPNQTYNFTAKIKTEALNSKIGARVRILSFDSNNKQQTALWYSKSLVGDQEWTTITEEFTTGSDIVKIRLELFYETGTGKAYFDDVSLTKKEETKPAEPETSKEINFYESITLNTAKRFPLNSEYTYTVKDNTVASVEDGFIVPKKTGTTELIVSAPGKKDKVVPLLVEATNETFDMLRKKWDTMISGNDYFNSESSYMNEIFESNEKDVEGYLAKVLESDTKIWEDLGDYTKSPNFTKTYRRLEQIAKAVTNKKSKYYNDKNVLNMVKRSMKLMNDHYYNENTESKGNWWDYEIGTPRAINNILTIMNDYFSKEEIRQYLAPVSKLVPDPSKIMVSQNRGKTAVGGNLSDLGKVKIIEGILLEDSAKLEVAMNAVSDVLALVTEGEGFHHDGSYVDHTNIAYTGAYGNVLIDGFSQLLPVIQASPYKISDEKLSVLYKWIYEGFLPLIYRGGLMDMTRGRSLSRKVQNDHFAAVEVLRGILRIAQASSPSEKAKLEGLVKNIVKSDDFYDTFKSLKSFYDVHLFEDLIANPAINEIERDTYLKLYNDMDKVAYFNKERGFAFGISMYSNKIQNYEFMNKENAKGWYTSDGVSYLYNDDLSHFSDDYWATVDPYKLTGITENSEMREKGSGMTTMKNSFVGSTSLENQFATVAMDFTNWNNTLSAKKSWFILGDRVVFLGSGVKDSSGKDVYTVVENRKIKRESRNRSAGQEDYKVLVNGTETTISDKDSPAQVNTILLKSSNKDMNIGYKFLQPTTVNLKKEARTGTWKDINEGQSAEAVQNTFLSIVQPHDDANSTYAYVLYPNRDENEFAKEVASDDIEIIENSETNQVIYDKRNKIYGVVKYDDSELKLEDGLILKEKGIYTIRKDTDKIEVAFLNPDDRSSGIQELQADKYTLNNTTEPTVENSVRYYTYVLAAETPAESTEESSQTNAQTTVEAAVTSKEITSVNVITNSSENKELPDTGTKRIELTLIIAVICLTISTFLSKKRLQK